VELSIIVVFLLFANYLKWPHQHLSLENTWTPSGLHDDIHLLDCLLGLLLRFVNIRTHLTRWTNFYLLSTDPSPSRIVLTTILIVVSNISLRLWYNLLFLMLTNGMALFLLRWLTLGFPCYFIVLERWRLDHWITLVLILLLRIIIQLTFFLIVIILALILQYPTPTLIHLIVICREILLLVWILHKLFKVLGHSFSNASLENENLSQFCNDNHYRYNH
jgi:hypothetical protein